MAETMQEVRCGVCGGVFAPTEAVPVAAIRPQIARVMDLKAELEIRQLHEKLDHLLLRQWQRVAEIQQLQLDMMEELARRHRD